MQFVLIKDDTMKADDLAVTIKTEFFKSFVRKNPYDAFISQAADGKFKLDQQGAAEFMRIPSIKDYFYEAGMRVGAAKSQLRVQYKQSSNLSGEVWQKSAAIVDTISTQAAIVESKGPTAPIYKYISGLSFAIWKQGFILGTTQFMALVLGVGLGFKIIQNGASSLLADAKEKV